ncbi:hypothetical protein [Citricoccus sp. NR2]|uniref:hypothetical protein n=1 Tax=Citricoccus sp. NR2 TaxID=3004095 RepID=UPI0022DE4D21|nr:hypothetical protein [Citricoccus sp. NR2]WBL20327.1 hypothetical protein O1A05_06510 [Citricoccus sp. NR2]
MTAVTLGQHERLQPLATNMAAAPAADIIFVMRFIVAPLFTFVHGRRDLDPHDRVSPLSLVTRHTRRRHANSLKTWISAKIQGITWLPPLMNVA